MEVSGGGDEGFVREWTPCTHILNLIPRSQAQGIFSSELCLTCVDAVSEFIALGTNLGLVYWYDRKKGTIERLRCEAANTPITFVKIVSTVDYMVGAGNAAGQVTVFQIPKEHPDNVPDRFKPKVEPKVERYTIGDLHSSPITAIEWSKNGMRLFSGDKNGVIIMTEIDFYMHLCKSMEIVNEEHEIVQMSYYQNSLLVSSVYRTIVCERRDARWHVTQIGNKERKSLCRLGAVWVYSYARGGAAAAYCARPGLRLWRADTQGTVLHTLLFKDAISNPLAVVELLNPSPSRAPDADASLGPLRVFRDSLLVTHDARRLYVLDPDTLTARAVLDQLRQILSVAVTQDEIFVLEGPRSLVRLAHAPEPAALHTDIPAAMTRSLTTSIQQAVNTVRDLTLDQTVPYITSVLEQPISLFTKNEIETATVAEECNELPPIKTLPGDISENVLESIINEFKVSNEVDELRRAKSEELQKKLKLYNSIMGKKYDEELIHSRRSRRKDGRSGASTPRSRMSTPVRQTDGSRASPAGVDQGGYGSLQQESDDLLEQQIEEKEKILAKMLNLESLSLKTPTIEPEIKEPEITYKYHDDNEFETKKPEKKESPKEKPIKIEPIDLVPKIMQLPNNWNLENIELRLDIHSNMKNAKNLMSPDDNLEADWEII